MSKYIPLHIIEFLEFSLKNNVLVQSSADTNKLAVLSSYNPSRLGGMCTILGVLMTFGGALRTNLEILGVLQHPQHLQFRRPCLVQLEYILKSSRNLIEYAFSQLMAYIFSVPFNFPRIFQKLDRYYCPLLYDRIRSYQYAVCKIILLLPIVYQYDSSKNLYLTQQIFQNRKNIFKYKQISILPPNLSVLKPFLIVSRFGLFNDVSQGFLFFQKMNI